MTGASDIDVRLRLNPHGRNHALKGDRGPIMVMFLP
jgi:hypothetical protein